MSSINKSIAGGLDVPYTLNPNLHFGVNWGNCFTRQLQGNLKAQEGEMLWIDGSHMASINDPEQEDNDLISIETYNGISLKLIASH